jgi:hypothetical protein
MGIYEISAPFYNIHRFTDTSKMKQVIRLYDGMKAKIRKMNATHIYETGPNHTKWKLNEPTQTRDQNAAG